MKTRLDLSDAVIAELVVQVPPARVALLPTLLDVIVQQEQVLVQQAPTPALLTPPIKALADGQGRTAPNSQQPSTRDGFQQQPCSWFGRSGQRPGGHIVLYHPCPCLTAAAGGA